jgi:hypothetical protein
MTSPVFGWETDEARRFYADHTRGLAAGWYVVDGGFFWNDTAIRVIVGPFSTHADALTARTPIEQLTKCSYYVDEVKADA